MSPTEQTSKGAPEHENPSQEPRKDDKPLESLGSDNSMETTVDIKPEKIEDLMHRETGVGRAIKRSIADVTSSHHLRKCNLLMFLPLCHWYGQYNRVSHAKVKVVDQTIDDDEAIFNSIRTTYFVSRGWLRRFFSIWRLRKIERIKVCISGKFKLIHSFVYSILTLSRFLIPMSITLSVRIR